MPLQGVRFQLCPSRLCRFWETGGTGKGPGLHGHPLEGGLRAALPYIFLLITDFLKVSSGMAHNHPLVSIGVPTVQTRKTISESFSGLHEICSRSRPGLQSRALSTHRPACQSGANSEAWDRHAVGVGQNARAPPPPCSYCQILYYYLLLNPFAPPPPCQSPALVDFSRSPGCHLTLNKSLLPHPFTPT